VVEVTVPTIAIFFGIVVRMWHDDHPSPHIHIEYQDFKPLDRIQGADRDQAA
jgi:hypothetical protein